MGAIQIVASAKLSKTASGQLIWLFLNYFTPLIATIGYPKIQYVLSPL